MVAEMFESIERTALRLMIMYPLQSVVFVCLLIVLILLLFIDVY